MAFTAGEAEMSTSNTSQSMVRADAPETEADGTPKGGQSLITIHTSKGEMQLAYDPNTLEVDHDIGILCSMLQSMRNFGILTDATVALYITEGTIQHFNLSEIKVEFSNSPAS